MINYRLLRDNKESGPYSEEEMIAKGFKPYDLLWAEGRSAGWQYPSEIPAFKNYAPIVEEQPYDRFYKKQPQQKSALEERYSSRSYTPTSQPSKANEIITQQQQPIAARPAYDYNVQSLPGKNIHVTLPSGNTINLTTLVAKKEAKESKDTIEKNNTASVANNTTANSIESNIINAAKTNTDTPDKLNTDKKQSSFTETVYQPMQVVKQVKAVAAIPVNAIPQNNENDYSSVSQQVYRAKDEYSWSLVLGAVIGIATLVGLGIMIGLGINRQKNEDALNEALNNRPKQIQSIQQVPVTKPEVSSTTAIPASVTDEPVSKPVESSKNKELVQNAVVKTDLQPLTTEKDDKKSLVTEKTDKSLTDKTKPIQTQETTVQHSKPLTPDAMVNIEKVLSVSSNNFKTGAFGGISGLKCTLFNGSKLPLESVIVEIDYVQANDKIYKTERIQFKDISAGSQATIDAPASPRGVKIISRIIKISPRDAALSNTTASRT